MARKKQVLGDGGVARAVKNIAERVGQRDEACRRIERNQADGSKAQQENKYQCPASGYKNGRACLMALITINKTIPQISAKINTDTLCGGMRANSQSFNTAPFLFWMCG